MKRMLDGKLPMLVTCWIVITGMVLTSSPAFSSQRNSSNGGGNACERDNSRDRNWSPTVRVVREVDPLPAIIATGLIAGITFSLMDNHAASVNRTPPPVYCPTTTGRVVSARAVMVTTGLLNIRSGPGLYKPCIGKLYRGTMLTIMRTSGGWYYVMTPDGVSGWVMSQYTTPAGFPADG